MHDHLETLKRLPPEVRAVAEREANDAAQRANNEELATGGSSLAARESREDARMAALAPFAAAADEADRVAEAASSRMFRALSIDDDRSGRAKAAGDDERADFWRRWLAGREVDRVWEVPPPAAPTLIITGPDGAVAVLDALLRYLADKPAETLLAVAALVKALPCGDSPSVSIGSEAPVACALIAAQSKAFTGVTSTTDGRPLAYASVEIDGVEFTARHTKVRP